MKRLLAVIILAVVLQGGQVVSAQQRTVSDLAGNWETTDGSTGNLRFLDNSQVVASLNGLVLPTATYSIDFTKDPIWFDVTLPSSKTVKGLLQFIDDNTIQWQVFLAGGRGLDFEQSDQNPIYVLTRKQ